MPVGITRRILRGGFDRARPTMSSTPLTENALSLPAGLVVSLRLLAAIVIFAAIAPGILMTAPAVAAQLASEWQLKPGQIGWLFSAELGAMSGDAPGVVVDEPPRLAAGCPDGRGGVSGRQPRLGGGHPV